MFDFLYENKVSISILSFIVLLIIIAGIVYYYYYYDNTDKDQTVEDIDAEIIKSLEEGPIEERTRVLLNYLDKKIDYQEEPKGISYLKRMDKNKRLELYKNIELKYIEKIIIIFETANQKKYRNEILDILDIEDKELLIINLRNKNIILDIKEDIIGSKLIEIIELLNKNTAETSKMAVSILCFDNNKDILIQELKKRDKFKDIVTFLNNENYQNISCKKELLGKKNIEL